MTFNPQGKLWLPGRRFKTDQHAHMRNVLALEEFIERPLEVVKLNNQDAAPSGDEFPNGSLTVVNDQLMRRESGLWVPAVSPDEFSLSGTLAARPAAGTAGRFYNATDVGILYRDTGAAWQDVAYKGTVATIGAAAVTASAAAQTPVLAYTVPANAIQAGSNFWMEITGAVDQRAAVDTITFRVTYGGTTLASLAVADAASARTDDEIWCVARVNFRSGGAASSVETSLRMLEKFTGAGTVGRMTGGGAAVVGPSTTVARDLAFTIEWSAAAGANAVEITEGAIKCDKL